MSIGVTAIILFAVFALLLFASCPISVSIVISSIVAAISSLSWDQITFITMQKMNSGVESFSLLAIPLFILAGNIMNNGGIARRLVNFAKLFVGWLPCMQKSTTTRYPEGHLLQKLLKLLWRLFPACC